MGSRLLNGFPQLSVRVTLFLLILIVLLSTVTSGTIAGTVGVIIGVVVGIIVKAFAVEVIEGGVVGIIVEVLAAEIIEVTVRVTLVNKYEIHNGDHVIYVHKANIFQMHIYHSSSANTLSINNMVCICIYVCTHVVNSS